MTKIEVELPDDQAVALERLARDRSISVTELIRQGVGAVLGPPTTPDDLELRRRALALSGMFSSGLGDLARRHDDYLAEDFDE